MHLSKTSLLAGLQCRKHLHLLIHHPELATFRESPAIVTGRVVGEHARLAYPGGVLVQRRRPDADPFAQTRALLDDTSIPAIFEAGFQAGDIEVFVDILERRGDRWNLIEVKASAEVKDDHIDDIAIQAFVLGQAGIPVNRVKHMHINKAFVYQGNGDYQGLFIQEDVTERVRNHLWFITGAIDQLKEVITGPQPERHIGSHCNKPYECEYKPYCTSHDAVYPVAWLPNGAQVTTKLIRQGIYDIRDIPYDTLNSETHLRVRRVTIAGEAEYLPGANAILDQLACPRCYLDFECIQFAIPIWQGTRPYQQLPFQWSCHIQHEDGTLQHEEFLDTSGDDPRRRFAESLIAVCGSTGAIMVYNQAFEKRIIRELADRFPDLSGPLLALNERVFDLLPVVRKYYYHPDMKGSWSIKNVLPCLAPELDYAQVGQVQDGTQAQAAYLEIINGSLEKGKRAALIHDLREYCRLDTFAMVRIAEALTEFTS